MEGTTVKNGDRFRTLCNIETVALVQWKAPATSSGPCEIPAGTFLVANHDQKEDRPGFSCIPEDYEAFTAVVVPEWERFQEKFDGYYFVLHSADIGTKLELIDPK